MILFKRSADLRQYLDSHTKNRVSVGFVPTMGALHQGHQSLVDASLKDNKVTVTSIFINPTQFNDQKDFERYPVTIEKDLAALEKGGCDVVFIPSVHEIYPAGTTTTRHYPLGPIENLLEGQYRPGHFQGVCQVVDRLLDIVQPGNLYLGQKDYQQCMVINRLLKLTGRESQVKIKICPTLRDVDGLAMSSRNLRLDKVQRDRASQIYETLNAIRKELSPGALQPIKEKAKARLAAASFKVDYVEIADADTLEIVNNWDGQRRLVALIAAFNGEVRLIDNMLM